MKIVMATYGSRGDVQPLITLTLALRARGHRVTLAGPPEWRPWAVSMGCPYTPLGGDLRPFLARVEAAHRPRAAAAFHRRVMAETRRQFEHLPAVISGADLVIGASLCLALPSVAEALSIPYRYLAFTPQMLPSSAHPCPIFRRQHLPGWINRLGWRLVKRLQRLHLLPAINRHRRRLALPPLTDFWEHLLGALPLLACDAALAPVPSDVARPVVQTGYLHLGKSTAFPAGGQLLAESDLAPELRTWLAAGSRPLFAGFGSMPPGDARRWIPMVTAAVRALGRRLILQTADGMGNTPPSRQDLYMGTSFPHPALFPRTRAVIHHGGAGTTATAARSGVPQIIVPHILDQYFWAKRIHHCGLSPTPIWRDRLDARRLHQAMEVCLRDRLMAANAVEMKRRLEGEAPLLAATRAVEGV